jgi:hypothetical protein
MPSVKSHRDNTAIVFFSHVFSPVAVEHLQKLKRESSDYGVFFVYSDAAGDDPPQTGEQVMRFDFQAISKEYPRILGSRLIPGNCHLTLLNFFKRRPHFQYYWVIEYDVMFTGHWKKFFEAFTDQDTDFIACHLRRREDEPGFFFWNTIEAPIGTPLPGTMVRAFCPVQRVSRRSLEMLEVWAKAGWVGHFEGLVPTLLEQHGYSLADIGGDGPYTPPGCRNRFYTSFSWRDAKLRNFGTMRFRPSVRSLRFAVKNRLYHPVKHPPGRFISKSALAEMRTRLSYIVFNLKREPVEFSKALARFFFLSPRL